MITNQSKYKHIKYGLLTSDKNGCGWIAAYNALKHFGYDVTPESVAKAYGKRCLWLWGLFGTHPEKLIKNIKTVLKVTAFYYADKDVDLSLFKADAGILFYWTKSKQAHYVFFKDINNNQVEIYNHQNYNIPVVMDKTDFFKDKKYSILLLLSR